MTINKKAIAIIPARSGSKRIPRKNIKLFLGKPMIAWSISTAIESGLFDRIIVSTDDPKISKIARDFGAEVPFLRPADLSDDLTPIVPVMKHAINVLVDQGVEFEYACCIFPCAPLIEIQDLSDTFEIIKSKNIDFIYPVSQYAHPIQRAMRKLANGKMEFLNPGSELQRTQDLEITFHDAGQFYWGKRNSWLDGKKMHSDGLGYEIPTWRVVDIDASEDWERAEILVRLVKQFVRKI